jgi:hypothetical protein
VEVAARRLRPEFLRKVTLRLPKAKVIAVRAYFERARNSAWPTRKGLRMARRDRLPDLRT